MKAKGTSGKHLGGPPYGYRSDPQNKELWSLDKDAAPVVKRIFDMTMRVSARPGLPVSWKLMGC